MRRTTVWVRLQASVACLVTVDHGGVVDGELVDPTIVAIDEARDPVILPDADCLSSYELADIDEAVKEKLCSE